MLEVLTSYTWPNDGFPFASLDVRVNELARRLGLDVQQWDVDGLGRARGFGFRAASGRVYLLEEVDLSVTHSGTNGPGVYVDAGELATVGSAILVADVIAALGLAPSEVVVVADTAAEKFAAQLVAKVARARLNRTV